MSNLGYKQVAQVQRRRWDTEAYEKKAAARKERELAEEQGRPHRAAAAPTDAAAQQQDGESKPEFQPAPAGAAGPQGSQRAFLAARKGKVGNIDDKVGSTEMISVEEAAGAAAQNKLDVVKKTGVGWHCSVCDCFLKDSHTYLDHINGRKHQRALGFSMRVERSTESDLMNKLSQLQQQKNQKKEKEEINYDKLVQDKDEEERLRKEERQRKRKERRRIQKEKEAEPEQKPEPQPEEEEGEEEEVDETGGIDPNLAAMMGFSGFSSTKN